MKVGARVRTRNMASMLVTLDVSRFSGWLKASALCRVARGGTYEAGGSSGRDVRGRWAGLRSRMQGRPVWSHRARVRTANMCSMVVTLDVSKLSGWLNADVDCREPKGGHTVRCEGRAWRREAAWRRATAVHAACRGGLDCRLGAGHGEECT